MNINYVIFIRHGRMYVLQRKCHELQYLKKSFTVNFIYIHK